MSERFPGGFITKTAVIPTTTSASGIWTLDQALTYIKAGTWPLQPYYYIGTLTGAALSGYTANASNSNFAVCYTFNSYTFGTAVYTASGSLSWQTQSSSTGSSFSNAGGAVDSSGNVYMQVGAGTLTVVGGRAFSAFKFNASGTQQWGNAYTGTGSNYSSFGATVDASGNFYASGSILVSCRRYGMVMKLDSTGAVTWSRRIGDGTYDYYNWGVAVAASGNIYASGYESRFLGVILTKLDSGGTRSWTTELYTNNGDGSVCGVAVDSSENVYLCSTAYLGVRGMVTAKFNSSGTLLWQKILGDSNSTYGYGVAVDSAGNVYSIGTSNATGSGLQQDILIAKYNSSGTLQWQRYLSGSTSDTGMGISIAANGSICVAGYTTISTVSSVIFARLPPDGSGTGSYNVGGTTVTYGVSTTGVPAGSMNQTSVSVSAIDAGMAVWGAISSTASSLTSNVTSI